MNTVFRLVNPENDMDTSICKVNVFAKQAKYESNTVFFFSFRVFNMQDAGVYNHTVVRTSEEVELAGQQVRSAAQAERL